MPAPPRTTIDDVVNGAAQFKSEMTSDEAYELCAKAVRGEPMRSVEIPKDSQLRPSLFHYRAMFPHPLPHNHPTESRYENDRAMRKIQHLKASQRMWYAVASNRPWCVEELFMSGFPVNAPNPSGITPLHLACHLGHATCVEILLNIGVDPTKSTSLAGVDPVESALAAGHRTVVNLLQSRGFLNSSSIDNNSRGYRSIIDAASSLRTSSKQQTVADDLAVALRRPPYYLEY